MKKILMTFLSVIFMLLLTIDVNASTTYIRGIVKATNYVTREPSSNSTSLRSDENTIISLNAPESVEIIGEQGNYYQIKFLWGGFVYTGYYPKSKIETKTYVSDDEYIESLVKIGFPRDYAEKLGIVHAIHPNWTFAPSFTGGEVNGMDFYTAVKGEASVVARNLISGNNTSLRSTADGAYQNGQWLSLSGAGWYAASEQTIAFYMDPRNFLNESHIFMFENLGYNGDTQTDTVVGKIIGASFMKNPFICVEGANQCVVGTHSFVDTFVKVGIDKRVSPVHLASRVIVEQGSTGSLLSLGLGYNNQYVGYYNFFNINASGITTEEVILNGLRHAYNRNWNNPYVSIYEGSSLIANNYINRGQSTRYYQKFNTIVKSYYSNQYMQNVESPYTEGYTTYTGYYNAYNSLEEWNDSVYDFLIPVYTNMGTMTTLDTSGNGDATLKQLKINECRLSPEFQSSAYDYECFAKKEVEEINVEASATNGLAKVENAGIHKLENDETIINLVVTAANGNQSTYTVKILRLDTDGYTPEEVMNGIGIKTSDTDASNIALGSDVSNIVNNIKNKYYFAEVHIYDVNGTEITEGVVKTGQKISIKNAGIIKEYVIKLYGDTSGDGLIDIRDLLIIQKHLVKSKVLENEFLRSADINKDSVVDIRDLLLVQKSLLNSYEITQG